MLYRRQVTFNEGEIIKDKNRMNLFMETSAKSGFNVEELFCRAAKILYEESIKNREVNKVSKNNIINYYIIYNFYRKLILMY